MHADISAIKLTLKFKIFFDLSDSNGVKNQLGYVDLFLTKDLIKEIPAS